MPSPTIAPAGTILEERTMTSVISDQAAQALAILASEWFKTSRRLAKLTQEATPTRFERERAQLVFSQGRVEAALAEAGLRMVTYDAAQYSAQLPVEPANPEDFDTDEGLMIKETLEPTIMHDGRVLARGLVVLGKGA